MIADHANRVLIGTPAKTGCTSLEFSIRYRDDVPEGLEVIHWDGSGKKPHGLIVPGDCERYTRYMTVRHPLDRLVSLYYHLRKPYNQTHEWPAAAEALAGLDKFNDFVRWWLDQRNIHGFGGGKLGLLSRGGDWQKLDWWLQPNIWLITLGECYKVFGYPHLIRLESYVEDLSAINPYWAKVPHRMKSETDTSWQKHFNKSTLKKVMDDHADEELELLDYAI